MVEGGSLHHRDSLEEKQDETNRSPSGHGPQTPNAERKEDANAIAQRLPRGAKRERLDSDHLRRLEFEFPTVNLDSEDEDDENQLQHPDPEPVVDARYQALERKMERLERRLEAYESLHRKRARGRSVEEVPVEATENQQLIEFFLTEMEKQQAVVARMAAAQEALEKQVLASLQQTRRFHHQQLQRMTNFHEVLQLMEKEFVQGTHLRDEEKELVFDKQNKRTSAVRRALSEQITDLKTEAKQQRRRLELKFEKRVVDLAAENQAVKEENLQLKDDLQQLVGATRSNKRTLRILSEEILKLKRLVGPVLPAGSEQLYQSTTTTTAPLTDPYSSKPSRSVGRS